MNRNTKISQVNSLTEPRLTRPYLQCGWNVPAFAMHKNKADNKHKLTSPLCHPERSRRAILATIVFLFTALGRFCKAFLTFLNLRIVLLHQNINNSSALTLLTRTLEFPKGSQPHLGCNRTLVRLSKTYLPLKPIFATILFLFTLMPFTHAQSNYPIYVSPTLTPPYTLKLSEYSKFGSQNLMVNITVNDLNIKNLPVKLRIKLETVGVTIENPPTINTTPIYLDGGATTLLFGNDLKDYFQLNNLIFKGYSKEAYARTGQLPEGFYKFTVEVLHFQTNRLISNSGTATAWIVLGKPPVLKVPVDNAQLGQFKGMPLTFSWMSSNVGSPISAGSIQYKFEMWEMRIKGVAANTVVASIPVFHENTSFTTLYTLYPASLLMEPGMQYAWRVTAFDASGFVPFEQDGHSEVRTFTYKQLCDTVSNFEASHLGQSGLFSWEPQENHTSFNVEMRNPKTGWVSNSQTYENRAEFFELDYGSTYEMRVQAVCDGDDNSTSDFSGWQSVTIPQPKPLIDSASCPNCACDDDIPEVELKNFELRDNLQPGDTIANKTGTTRFIVKTIEKQGTNTYKGIFLFWAEIWNLKIVCEYWDLQVNTDDVIVNMDFESVYNPQFLIDVDATADYLNNLANAINTLSTSTAIKDTLSFNQTISSVYVNGGDSLYAITVDKDGNLHEVLLHADVDDIGKTLIVGENGEQYVVTSNGTVMGVAEYQNTGGNKSKMEDYNQEKENNSASSNEMIDFLASNNQKYGFDAYNEEKTALQNEYPTLNNGYTPAYKSVASYSTDKVGVSTTADNISFKDEMGIPALLTGRDLTIRGSSAGTQTALYANRAITDSTSEVAGKLNIMSFDEQFKKLYIVSVNGAKVPDSQELKKELNRIYAPAIIQWEVTKADSITGVNFENGNMTHGGTSVMAVYNADQRAVVNAYADKNNSLENDAYYLFFVENVQYKERSIAGYMPLQHQAGFIYGNPGLNIIAHEIAHGAFNLYHTFSTENYISAEQSTQNLMDYSGGTELWKHQWDLIHSPNKMLLPWLQDEKEGENVFYRYCIVEGTGPTFSLPNEEKEFYTFISLANKPVSVSKKVTGLRFSENFVECRIVTVDGEAGNNKNYSTVNPYSKLTSFKLDGIQYIAKIDNDNFVGYQANNKTKIIPCEVDGILMNVDMPDGKYYEDIYTPKHEYLSINKPIKDNKYSTCVTQYKASKPYLSDGDITKTEISCNPELESFAIEFANELDRMIKDEEYISQEFKFINDELLEVFQDRFKVFHDVTGKDEQSKAKRIFILSKEINIHFDDNNVADFTKLVVQNSKMFDKSKMLLLCIPYKMNKETSQPEPVRWFSVQGYKTDFELSDQNLIANFYKQVPKPYYCHNYVLFANGSFFFNETISKEYITGHPEIYDLKIHYDQNIDKLHTDFNLLFYTGNSSNSVADDYTIRTTTIDYYNSLVDEIKAIQNLNKPPVFIPLDKTIRLKESAIPEYRTAYMQGLINDFYKQHGVENYLNNYFSTNGIPNDKLYLDEIQDLAYDVLDVIGLGLAPFDCDFITDGLGGLIAVAVGDKEESAIYLSAVALQFAPVFVLKKGLKFIKYGDDILVVGTVKYKDELKNILKISESAAASLKENNLGLYLIEHVELKKAINAITDIGERDVFVKTILNNERLLGHVGISTEITGDISKILKNGGSPEKLSSILDEFAALATEKKSAFLNKLKDFTPDQIATFADDLAVIKNKNPEFIAKFGEDLGLIDSWKVLCDAGETGLSGRIDDITKVDDYLKNNSTKTAQNVVDDIKANGWQKCNDDLLKNEFLTKIGKALPENWNKFSPENNVEFAERLKAFRGNDDLTFDADFRGGEGQLFDSPLSDDLVLKRWFSSRVKDMPESIRLLKEAESLVKTNPELGKLMEVVSVGEKGSDWVVRGFNTRSVPLKNMVSDPLVAKVRQDAIDILSSQSGEIAANILKKLNKNSANVHWSDVSNKILIIDMQ